MSFLLAFVGFSLLILLHELGHFAAAKKVGMRVERFSLFFPPHIFKRQKGETEYAIGVIPLGGYVRITGMTAHEEIPEEVAYRAYHRMPVWKRVVVIGAGPGMNLLIAFLIFFALFLFVGTSTVSKQLDTVEKGSPAAAVLHKGDEIVAVDGKRGDVTALTNEVATHRCAGRQVDGCTATTPAKVTIRRDGRLITETITPKYDAQAGRPRLGFAFATQAHEYGVASAAGKSISEMARISKATVTAVVKLFYDPQARKQVNGIVGSYETTRAAINFDWAVALQVLGIISLSLALVNLFPFLPLDGGHIFWALAEKVRGRAIPFSVMERASVVGFILIIALFAIGLTNDIDTLRGSGFGIR